MSNFLVMTETPLQKSIQDRMERLHKRYALAIHRYCRNRLLDSESEDMARRVFLEAFTHFQQKESALPDEDFEKYWRTVARSRCNDRITGAEWRRRALGVSFEEQLEFQGSHDQQIERMIRRVAAMQLCTGCLGRLSEAERELILAYAEATRSNVEWYWAAEQLQMSYGTVRYRVEKILKKLRVCLERQNVSWPPHDETDTP
jgi:RNA polymerase sigma factor (sigma-70 family)